MFQNEKTYNDFSKLVVLEIEVENTFYFISF